MQPHEVTVCALATESVNSGHDKQPDDAVHEYVPTEQLVHTALPVPDFCFPAAQAAHVLPSGPVYPALHVQALMAVLCPRAFAFPGHCKHVVAPDTSTYLPSVQLVHVVAPVTEIFPAAHGVHVCMPVTLLDVPAPAENFPATHKTHVVAPVPFVYFPATQLVHADATAPENCPDPHDRHVGSTVVLYWPAAQPVQAVAPLSENFPAAQGGHATALWSATSWYVLMPQGTQQIPVAHASQQPQHLSHASSY